MRLPGHERKQRLIDAAMPLAEQHGYRRVSRDMVAEAAEVSPALLSRYWSAPQFHTAIMTRAVETANLRVIGQGLADRHPVALSAPIGLRHAAAARLIGG